VVEHYVYRVFWSGEDEAFVGTVAELPSLSWVADTQLAAFEGIQRLAAEVVEDLIADGQSAPEAISDRTYSGKFQVRLTPEQHRRLAADAAEQNVSLNRLIASRLAG
jgi:predicted HicB family RNase H-like nuclease